ncbi:MAG: flippase-like domain-containing protein [Firmicutes bacterium]|nr:flippase-like domain-containing protein [Bacillota bacterium]MCM1401282.1 flippase-like domain-containing protein [Bacteroides sp.]MCM1476763.1 flippase-like domain-containing protein [Bacteroides sp.]
MNRSIILKTLLPVAIGAGVVVWLFCREFSMEQWLAIPWTLRTFAAIAIGILFVAGREWGMMWRFRTLSDRTLSWRRTLKVTMQCEFTSAITPTTAGGSTLSMVFLNRQGIPLGRATIITMIVLMLDELFIVVACPIIFLLLPGGKIFGFDPGTFSTGVRLAFWIVYGGVCAVTLFLFLGAFVFPGSIARFISKLFRHKLLRRWHKQAVETGEAMVEAGADLRQRGAAWWFEALGATAFTWICRYLVVNALFWGFSAAAPQTIVFARQFVVWTLLTISPTPGGSGLSEWLFTSYYGDLITDASMVLVIAILWRLLTYYIYLAIGVIRLPAWIRKK